jgi:hypothetical protein
MAEELAPEKNRVQEEVAGEGHNGPPLTDDEKQNAIQEFLYQELLDIERREASIKEEKKNARNRFKNRTGISLKTFDAARTMASIEDDDERNDKKSHFDLVFKTLAPGEQADWVEATQNPE